ncbi:cysteine--tRNA ligase [Sediminibacterium sp.]|uniref:cysteine--tRNA ligase n=1 Tax=Sediminibacterium sp. TaxID=1917865 RepID=UPI0027328B28|nr:cysteine--tRNA ligase [Sediminibacterium sp.]MDP3567499.1 cysteine--tRNA ligase [Sediminibacterium sp.]
MQPLFLYNTLTRKKEEFKPINPPLVGLYVCGPTVYSDVHLGNCRTFISFDMIYRYLVHLGYKVRYVRNITDAGHLEGDRDEGDDKFAKKAKLEQLEPMEIVQKYTVGFHDVMRAFNNIPPSIEPTATGHICEQIEMIKQIMDKGFAYETEGTIYFDVEKYNKDFSYGQLTNRKLDELLEGTRELSGQDEKRGRLDFALWIKAKPETLMRWPSPWGWGFPGWHIECSAMSSKYLGDVFDIHGGGMDLQATHHTNEIAQSQACNHKAPVNYWMHTNMLTVNGVRMSKSAGNGFLPGELFTGDHPLLEKGYSPMAVRFFMMQTHYHSTLDFSNEALQASEKGFERLMDSYSTLQTLKAGSSSSEDIKALQTKCYDAMNDDFNTPILVAHLFDAARIVNSANDNKLSLTQNDIDLLKTIYQNFVFDVMGLQTEQENSKANAVLAKVMSMVLDIRNKAKVDKNFPLSDEIRNKLTDAGVQIKDGKEGSSWKI